MAKAKTAKRISLPREAEKLLLKEPLDGARSDFIGRAVSIFLGANVAVLLILVASLISDVVLLYGHTILPNDRIISDKVIISLIGATTIQLGAIMVLIAKFLFRRAA